MNAENITPILDVNQITKDQSDQKISEILNLKLELKQEISNVRLEMSTLEKKLIEKISESCWRLIFILGSIQALFGFFIR